MPKGDFEGLSSLKLKDDAVLEVTMSDPQSYYLRGYTGSVYNKHGWETTDKKVLYHCLFLIYIEGNAGHARNDFQRIHKSLRNPARMIKKMSGTERN